MTIDSIISQINLMQIIVFTTVAKENSFSAAGQLLHMTQSAVSKSISRLETQLNLKLFERSTRYIRITPAGEYLFNRWAPMIENIQEDYRHAVEIAEKNQRSLRIGTVSTANAELFFWPLADRFSEKYPSESFTVESDSMDILLQKLIKRSYDLIFLPHFERYTLDNLHIPWKWAARDQVYAYMSVEHPLAKKDVLSLTDLAGENLLALDKAHTPNYVRDLTELFASENLSPCVTRDMPNPYTLKTSFRTNSEIIIADAYFDYPIGKYTCRRPVSNYSNGIICAWNIPVDSKALEHFLEIVSGNTQTAI